MTQLRLVSDRTSLVTWVEADVRVRPGVRLTLKNHPEPTRLWDVVSVGQPHASKDIKRGFKNDI